MEVMTDTNILNPIKAKTYCIKFPQQFFSVLVHLISLKYVLLAGNY